MIVELFEDDNGEIREHEVSFGDIIAETYILFPTILKRCLEFVFLILFVAFFILTIYLHVTFITNSNCILIPKTNDTISEEWDVITLHIVENIDQNENENSDITQTTHFSGYISHEYQIEYLQSSDDMLVDTILKQNKKIVNGYLFQKDPLQNISKSLQKNYYCNLISSYEFSLHKGFLLLDNNQRNKYSISNISILVNTDNNICFGDEYSQYFLSNYLGYDTIVMNSFRNCFNNTGFIKFNQNSDKIRYLGENGTFLKDITPPEKRLLQFLRIFIEYPSIFLFFSLFFELYL